VYSSRLKYEKKKRRRRCIVLLLSFSVIVLCAISLLSLHSKRVIPPEHALHLQITKGGFKEKQTFYQSLLGKNISLRWADLIVSKLKPFVNFKKAKEATYRLVTDAKGDMVKFVYEAGPTDVYEIKKDSRGEFIVERQKVPLQVHLVKMIGKIHSSLFEAMNGAGEQDQLALSFAEILAWTIDFHQDVREKDRFKVVVEKIYKGEQFIRYGKIHAVEYLKGEEVIRGVRFNDGYYNEEGFSLRKAFLKSPLRFSRISSRFSHGRRHPVLGGVFPHLGVDYAAPIGTPVWAVADGTVIFIGWNGGFGKQVIIRHMNGYKTYYGHLSRYGRGIGKGMRVMQKQVIGYVGSTGLSTGPHLDYRISKNGRYRNPMKESFPSGSPVRKEDREEFDKKKHELLIWLADDAPNPLRVDETTSDALFLLSSGEIDPSDS
jgi:murein DD-endopeptidase MepM/ murein hydrolase activator NlpD